MKKTLLSVPLAIVLLNLSYQSAYALSISVHQNGSTYFYDNRVLGDSNQGDQGSGDQKQESQSNDQQNNSHPSEAQQQAAEKSAEAAKKSQESQNNSGSGEHQQTQPFEVIQNSASKQIRFAPRQNQTDVVIENKDQGKVSPGATIKLEDQSTIKSNRINLDLPETSTSSSKRNNEDQNTQPGEVKSRQFQIQSEQHDDGSVELQFQSKDVKAALIGTQIVVDPKTKQIGVTTTNGKTQLLHFLPDEAVAVMKAAGFTTSGSIASQSAGVKLISEPDGTIKYSLMEDQPRKIFGLFSIKVPTKIELNDQTGKVTSTVVEPTNFLTRFIFSLAK